MDGAVEALETLQTLGIVLGLVTNGTVRGQEQKLDVLGLRRYLSGHQGWAAAHLGHACARISAHWLRPVGVERTLIVQPPQPILVVDLFPEILDELLRLLGGLAADLWQRPTACPGWSVKDVALHLLGVEVGNLSRRRDGQAVAVSITSWEELVTFVNDFNEAWVQAARRMSPRLVIDVLQCTGLQMCAFFRSLNPYAIGDSVSWVGPEPAPIWLEQVTLIGDQALAAKVFEMVSIIA
jgi:hypothetical protein